MIFSYITPSPALRSFIRDYLIAHFIFDAEQSAPLKPYAPKPEQGLTFFVNGGASLVNPLTGELQKAPPVTIFGQQVSRCNVHLAPEFMMFRVHFLPGALFRVVNVPLYEFAESYVDAERVLKRDVQEVGEQLANARSYAAMVALVEQFLLHSVRRATQDVHPVDRAASYLAAGPARVSLDWLANQASLSPRQFNRKFTERMGVGPKIYSRLVRFHHAYRYKESHPAVDWLTIAMDFGYTDYQHLVRDFKQFADVTPNVWLQEDRASPEHILKLSGT